MVMFSSQKEGPKYFYPVLEYFKVSQSIEIKNTVVFHSNLNKSIVFELQKWFIPKNKWQLTLQGGGTCPCAPPSATSLPPQYY